MKTCLAICFFLSSIFTAQEASAPVPVEEEPLHHVLLKNEFVTVIRLNLPAGERTLYHRHTHDRVAIYLSNGSTAQQNWGEKEGSSTLSKPGGFVALTLAGSSLTHRVHNVGSTAFDVLDVEILLRPETPSLPTAGAVAGENPSARVYKWVLAPGATSAMHTHTRPYLIVAATKFELKMTAPDGQSMTHEMSPGDFHWVDGKVTHSLSNTATTEGQILEVELK